MYLDIAGSGVDVKLVMPGPIDTEIWDIPGNEPALMDIEKVPAADCAAGIADAMADDGFEYYVPPVYPGGIGAKDLALPRSRTATTTSAAWPTWPAPSARRLTTRTRHHDTSAQGFGVRGRGTIRGGGGR